MLTDEEKEKLLLLEHPDDLECLKQIEAVALPVEAKNLLLAMIYLSNNWSQEVVAIYNPYRIENIIKTKILGGRLMSGCQDRSSNPLHDPDLVGYLILSKKTSPNHLNYGSLVSVLMSKMAISSVETSIAVLFPELLTKKTSS